MKVCLLPLKGKEFCCVEESMDPFRLQQYLTEKLRILKELLSVSERMKRGLDLPDMEEVTQWMARRQELIGRIDRMDEETRKHGEGFSLSGVDRPEGMEGEALSHYKAIGEVLQNVKTIDEECQKRIVLLRNEVKTELQNAFQGIITVRRYMGKPAHPPKFLDIRR